MIAFKENIQDFVDGFVLNRNTDLRIDIDLLFVVNKLEK